RADHEQEAVVLDLRDRVRACPSAQRPDQAVKSRSVSGRFAGMNRVRLQRGARELLQQEVLLVRQARGGEDADRLRAVALLHAPETAGRGPAGRLPVGRVQLAVLAADERPGEAVRMVDEVEGEAALDTEVAVVRDVARVGRDLDESLRPGIDVQIDLAADAAE